MLTFEKLSDLQYLPPDSPARTILREIIEKLHRFADVKDRTYQPLFDGYICLAEPSDIGHTFDQILPGYSYESAPWEAVVYHTDDQNHTDDQTAFFVAAFVPNNTACTLVLFPDEDWIPDSLRRVLSENLVPEAN